MKLISLAALYLLFTIRYLKWSEKKAGTLDWNHILNINLVMEWLDTFRSKTKVKACTLLKYMESVKLGTEFLENKSGEFLKSY